MSLRLGVVGLNEGNGHPFSYSAIFNGYDEEALLKYCPFPLIREYLLRDHRNELILGEAKVTHIWTQAREVSEDVARVAQIPFVVDRMEDMIGQVDAVLLLRDDPWNHLEMARLFLEAGLPMYIDKQLAHTAEDCQKILNLAAGRPLMAGSAARYTRDSIAMRSVLADRHVLTIHGMSRVTWMRYGHHLFEPIAIQFGLDIDWVRSVSDVAGHDIIQIRYASGINVMLEFVENVHLPIEFACYSSEAPPHRVPFEDFFYGFHAMLKAFVAFVKNGVQPFPREEMVGIAEVILAGDISKKNGGMPIRPRSLGLV